VYYEVSGPFQRFPGRLPLAIRSGAKDRGSKKSAGPDAAARIAAMR